MAIIAIWRVLSRRDSPSSPSRIAAPCRAMLCFAQFLGLLRLVAANASSRRNLHGLSLAHHEIGTASSWPRAPRSTSSRCYRRGRKCAIHRGVLILRCFARQVAQSPSRHRCDCSTTSGPTLSSWSLYVDAHLARALDQRLRQVRERVPRHLLQTHALEATRSPRSRHRDSESAGCQPRNAAHSKPGSNALHRRRKDSLCANQPEMVGTSEMQGFAHVEKRHAGASEQIFQRSG